MSADRRHLWETPDGSTNVDGFLVAYSDDDNVFWMAQSGHIQNVLDEVIDRLATATSSTAAWRASRAEQEPER